MTVDTTFASFTSQLHAHHLRAQRVPTNRLLYFVLMYGVFLFSYYVHARRLSPLPCIHPWRLYLLTFLARFSRSVFISENQD